MLRRTERRTGRLFRRYRETGDPRVLGVVFDKTAPELLKVALHLTRDVHRAEDALQSTYLTAMEKARQWDPERPLLPWLLAILANHARQAHRREKRPHARPRDVATTGDVADVAGARELERTCDAALDRMAEPYRHVLILHLRHGLSGVEIARALDRPDSTVRNQIARGLDLLRGALPAGVASGLALVATGGRGLAAVRAAVLGQAPGTALAGAAMTGTFWTLGGLLMSKKLAIPLVLIPLALIGGTTYHLFFGDEPSPAHGPPLAATRDSPPETPGRTVARPDASAPGIESVSRTRVDPAADAGRLHAEVFVKGTTAPAAGLSFEVWRFAEGRRGPSAARGTTGPAGLAVVDDLPPGDWFFDVRQGYIAHRRSLEITAGQETALRVEIPRGWDLQGIVVDRFGRPAPDVEVRTLGEADNGYVLARTGADGVFTAQYLLGDLKVWALAPGFQPSRRQHFSDRQGTAEVRLVLGDLGTRLTGRVEDEQGRPVPRAKVAVGVDLKAGSQFVQREVHDLETGIDGSFAVDWLPPGSHFVGAFPPDGDRERVTARWVETSIGSVASVALRLGDGARLTGRVHDPAGQPVEGVRVVAWHTDESGLGDFDDAEDTTDGAGGYELRGLIEGDYRVLASRGAIRTETELTLGRGEAAVWNTVLGQGGAITVRVLGPDGKAMPRWAVELRRTHESYGWVQEGIAYTDGEGRCGFEKLQPVEHQVRLLVEGFSVRVLQRDGVFPDRGEVLVQLSKEDLPSARIRGRVVDAAGMPVLDAKVTMVQAGGGGSIVRVLEVGKDGDFATGLLPPGGYSLHATSPDESSAGTGALFEVAVDQELDVGDLVLAEAARLVVRLASSDGEPIRHPVLRLGTPRDLTPGASDMQPDEVDGLYRLEGIQPGSYELRFFAADAAPRTLPVELSSGQVRELDLVVQRAVRVTLEIRCALREQGFGMLNGVVKIYDGAGDRVVFHRLWGYFDDFEKRLERVQLALRPGTYRVEAEEFGGERRELELLVPAGGLAEPFVLDLR